MSRNSSGTYTLPTGNPVVSGTVIEANWANSTLDDISAALTDSLSRSGKGGMSASLRIIDGSVSVPGLAFANETGSGAYRAAAGDWYLTVLGANIARLRASGVDVTGALGVSGAVTAASATINGNLSAWNHFVPDAITAARFGYNGSYPFIDMSGGSNYLSFGTTGAERMRINSTGGVSVNTTNMRGSIFSVEQTGTSVKLATFSNAVDSDFEIKSTASGVMTIGPSAGALAIQTQNAERMRIDSAGNVGIGTSSRTNVSSSANLVVRNSNSGVDIGGSTSTGYLAIRAPSSGAGAFDFTNTSTDPNSSPYLQGRIYYDFASNFMSFYTNGLNERMRINSSGNVGIGIAPDSRFALTVATSIGASNTNEAQLCMNNSASLVYWYNNASVNSVGLFDATANWSPIVFNRANSSWQFSTSSAERMRIDSSGRVLIGLTSTAGTALLQVSGSMGIRGGQYYSGGTDWQWRAGNEATGQNSYIVYNNYNTGVYLGWGATAWAGNSDIRLKNVTGTYDNALDGVMQLRPIKFTWKSDDTNKPCVGVIAQSVLPVVPEAVDEQPIPGRDDDTPYLSVRYTELIPIMIAAIQELAAKVATLEAAAK